MCQNWYSYPSRWGKHIGFKPRPRHLGLHKFMAVPTLFELDDPSMECAVIVVIIVIMLWNVARPKGTGKADTSKACCCHVNVAGFSDSAEESWGNGKEGDRHGWDESESVDRSKEFDGHTYWTSDNFWLAAWVKLSHSVVSQTAISESKKESQQHTLSARMSKITNDGLTWSRTGWFIAVPIWQQWSSEGLLKLVYLLQSTCGRPDL